MDFPELRKLVRELDALEGRRAVARVRAEALVPILEGYLGDRNGHGTSLQWVADRLDQDGIPAARGGGWSRVQVLRMLHPEVYHSANKRLDDLRRRVATYREDMPDHPYTALWSDALERAEVQQAASLEAAKALGVRLRALVLIEPEDTIL